MLDLMLRKKIVITIIKIAIAVVFELVGLVNVFEGIQGIAWGKSHGTSYGGFIVSLIFGLICLLIATLNLVKYFTKSKCPKCGARFSYVFLDSEVTEKDSVSVKMKENEYDSSGNVKGYREHYIPGVKTTTKNRYVCTKCQNKAFNYTVSSKANL